MLLDSILTKISDNVSNFPLINSKTNMFSKYIPMFLKNKYSLSWGEKITNIIGKAYTVSAQLGSAMDRKAAGIQNVHTVRELLSSEMNIAYICNGRDAVQYIFYPLLSDYLSDTTVNPSKKNALVYQIKGDIKKATEIAVNDHFPSRKKLALDGIEYTKRTISNVVKPYKV